MSLERRVTLGPYVSMFQGVRTDYVAGVTRLMNTR
jgi:hypothetical protein